MLNHIVIMGRLTRDPEYKATGTGLSVTNFSVAVDRDVPGQSGERETDFIDCVAWRKTAEFITKYFTKGSVIALSGRLQIRTWTDKDGNKRRTAEVVVDNAYFGSSKSAESGTGYSVPYPSSPQPAIPATNFTLVDEPDAQLPF